MGLARVIKKEVRYQDVIDLPENIVGEIIEGELYTHSRPTPRHALASSGLGALLHGPFQRGAGGPGGWIILDEPEIHIDKDVLVPDLAGWRTANMPKIPADAYFSLRPDWLAEVLSPSTARVDRLKKMRLYALWGTPHLWLIDPTQRTLESYRLLEGKWILLHVFSDETEALIEPFDVLPFDVTALWFLQE